ITWAAATGDLDALGKSAREAGHDILGPRDGSRTRPDGRVLTWKTLGVLNTLGLQGVEPIPFFIQWSPGSLHPSQDSPAGCELRLFAIHHPDPARVRDALKSLGIEAEVKPARSVELVAMLATPKGNLELH
ncbi:MAG TPA: VOC family protein, partial [Candidatus Methylomirabilis sp.]|nr:VOC family protein [Candidatus Methylomirabilis sp.]